MSPLPTVETIIGSDGQPCYQVVVNGMSITRHDRWQVDLLIEQLYAGELPDGWHDLPLGTRHQLVDTDYVPDPGV